jgi:hypothetical protein
VFSRNSEEWALRRDPISAGEPLGAGAGLAQGLVHELLVQAPLGHQAELAKGLGGPPNLDRGAVAVDRGAVGGGAGGFRDDQPASEFEQGSGALGDGRWSPEGAGEDPVEVPPEGGVAARNLRPFLTDRHTGLEAEPADRLAQEGRPAALGIEEDQRGLGPVGGDDEAGESAPRTQVQEDRGGGAVRPQAAADGDEAHGMTEVGVDGARAEEAGRSSLLEKLAELVGPGGRRGRRGSRRSRRSGPGDRGAGAGVGAGHRPVRTPGR